MIHVDSKVFCKTLRLEFCVMESWKGQNILELFECCDEIPSLHYRILQKKCAYPASGMRKRKCLCFGAIGIFSWAALMGK